MVQLIKLFEYLAKKNYNCISIPFNAGQGMALRVGYELGKLINAKYIVTMDADNQHIPSDILNMIQPLIQNKSDVVIGSGILGKNYDQQKIRSLGISFFSMLIRLLSGVKIYDISSGFKCFRAEVLNKLELQEYQYQSAEFLLSVIKAEFRIQEIPISFYSRKFGETKKGMTANYAIGFLNQFYYFFYEGDFFREQIIYD